MRKEKKRPNILFIMTDEQRHDTFSCVNSEIRTPHLDELIKDSIHFTSGYCANPSCIPSRAAIMTGKFPTQCRVPTFITYLPDDEITFMTRLREAGYYTAVAGKQHFGHTSIDKGYDEEYIVDGHSPGGDPEETTLYQEFLDREGAPDSPWCDGSLILGGRWLWDMKYHIDSFVAELGKEWLDRQPDGMDEQEKPWFFCLSFPGPHQPFDCEGTPYSEQYDLAGLSDPLTTGEDLNGKPPHFSQIRKDKRLAGYDHNIFKRTKRAYYANMSLIDEKVGEIVSLLKEKELYDDTLILYTADHGDFMGEFGMVGKGQYLSEVLMRVPLVIKPPVKGFRGYVTDDRVLNIDLAATCLDVAEGELGKDMSDFSWRDYWCEGKTPRKRDHIYMEAGGMKGVIKDGIKTVFYQNKEYGELYDLNNDPSERKNLWDEKEYQEHRRKAMGMIINQLISMSPRSDIPWNVNDPSL